MSALPVRAATAGTLALALALALPAAAFADQAEDDRGRSQAAQASSQERADERGRSETAPHGQGSDAGKSDDKSSDKADAESGDGGGEKAGSKSKSSSKGTSEGKGGQGTSGKGSDPRGNNGTVKIDGEAFDDGRGNEPHVGCVFQVDFYGFDAGDTASITFTGHAPTGGGLLHRETGTRISDDAAGGGQDRDATLTFSVQNQLSELLSVTPHPKQGWHVKLAVDVDSAPGGAKQKVFWIDCPQAPAAGGSTSPATSGGTTTTTSTSTATTGAATTGTPTTGAGTTSVLPATVVSGTTVAAAERVEAQTFGSGTLTLTGTETAAAAGSGVTSQSAARPSVLPFTGSQALLYLLGLGLSAVGVGAIAHRMGRQQADLS